MTTPTMPPPVGGVLETALYVDDLARATEFYERVLGLRAMVRDARLTAFDAGDRTVLLLFLRGASTEPIRLPGGVIPPHDGHGPIHVGLAVAEADLDAFERHLSACGVAVEDRVGWPRGGRSLYFRDPDGHLLELATPGLWDIY